MATAREIVDEAMRIIGEAAGAGVQIHAEDGMLETVNRVARLAFTRYSWDQFIHWQELELDGSTGLVTASDAFEDVKGLQDFLAIYREGEDVQIPKLARTVNPFVLTGSRVLCWSSLVATHPNYQGKRLQFYPLTATGTLNVCTRVDPSPYTWDDEIALDQDILVAGTAWITLMGDDLNPGAAEGQRLFMDERFNVILKSLALQPVTSSPKSTFPTDYFVRRP